MPRKSGKTAPPAPAASPTPASAAQTPEAVAAAQTPAVTPAPTPEEPQDEPAAVQPTEIGETPPAVDPEPEATTPPSPERMRLGQVEGLLHRVALEDVLASLDEPSRTRIKALASAVSVRRQQEEVLATEGRCAPPIFTVDDPAAPPALFARAETIAAALLAGATHIHVLHVAAGDADVAQTAIVGLMHGQHPPASPA